MSALERDDLVGIFVNGFDARARKIRAAVGDAGGAEAVMRLRTAADLEGFAADLMGLLPAEPPGTVTILPPSSADERSIATPKEIAL